LPDLFTEGDNKRDATGSGSQAGLSRKSKKTGGPEDTNASNDPERLSFFNGRCQVRVANCYELRKRAYRFQYQAYEGLNIVNPNKDALWLTIHDALPQTTTFIAEDNCGEIAGTVTLVFDSAVGLPADNLFPSEMAAVRRRGGRHICEVISFGTSEKVRGSVRFSAGLLYSSFLFAVYARKATDYVITVHERHEKFYESSLLFSRKGPVRCYDKVNGEPTVFMSLALGMMDKSRRERRTFPFAFFNYSQAREHAIAAKIDELTRPLTPDEFTSLFIEKTDTWLNASPSEIDFIKPIYAPDTSPLAKSV
jgi:hypothetical protein